MLAPSTNAGLGPVEPLQSIDEQARGLDTDSEAIGRQRVLNLKRKAEEILGKEARFFLFTSMPLIRELVESNRHSELLTEPLWYQGGKRQKVCMLDA